MSQAAMFSSEQRVELRRRVMAWANQTMIQEFVGGLIEGPGGTGPDLLLFAQGRATAIYLGESSSQSMPDEHNDWCLRWEAVGAPPMAVYLASSELGACQLLLNHLNLEQWDDSLAERH